MRCSTRAVNCRAIIANWGGRRWLQGAVAVVSLAGGIGSRWTKGAGVVKALNPFCRLAGQHRSFIEIHLAKSLRASRAAGTLLPHVITTSYLTHAAIESRLRDVGNYGYPGPLLLSPGGRSACAWFPWSATCGSPGRRCRSSCWTSRRRRCAKSLHATLIAWARQAGEGGDYTGQSAAAVPAPGGALVRIANLLRNGVLAQLLAERPQLRYLMVHNIDTAGRGRGRGAAGLPHRAGRGHDRRSDRAARGRPRRRPGAVDGRLRLVEGMALPHEEIESRLSYYNSTTYWIDIDRMLEVFGLNRGQLADPERVAAAVNAVAARMPTYITLKDVKKRWGKGQEDVFPVAQFEKLWGDMTALPEWDCRFVLVPRLRGQQLKEPAQLDGWLRDGSAAYVEKLCGWEAAAKA